MTGVQTCALPISVVRVQFSTCFFLAAHVRVCVVCYNEALTQNKDYSKDIRVEGQKSSSSRNKDRNTKKETRSKLISRKEERPRTPFIKVELWM